MDKSRDIVEKGRFELIFELSEIEITDLKTLLTNIKEIRGQHPGIDISVRAQYH